MSSRWSILYICAPLEPAVRDGKQILIGAKPEIGHFTEHKVFFSPLSITVFSLSFSVFLLSSWTAHTSEAWREELLFVMCLTLFDWGSVGTNCVAWEPCLQLLFYFLFFFFLLFVCICACNDTVCLLVHWILPYLHLPVGEHINVCT